MKIELPERTTEYKLNEMTYIITTRFSSNNKEELTAKIRRMILNDKITQSAVNKEKSLGAR